MQHEEVKEYLDLSRESMDAAIDHLQRELIKVRTGKANASLVSGLMVPYYGSPTPLNQVANVSASDSRTLVIQPWEKTMIAPIEKCIFEANLGVTPQNDGELIRISIPPLTEERRRELVKRAKHLGEEAKISVRNARRDAMESIKEAVKAGYPEDGGKRLEDEVQQSTNAYGEKIDHIVQIKEKDIMQV